MIQSTPLAENIRRAFQPTTRGVVGLVDELLGLCRTHQLRFDFQDSHCQVRRLGSDGQDSIELPLPKSVFRAVLARIAALCNEHQPNSVTPYRGEGELVVPTPLSDKSAAPSTCHAVFTNTPSEQRLELTFSKCSVPDGSRFTVLLRDNRTVTVFGHALKFFSDGPLSRYGILSHIGESEVLVALFPISEVTGVFSGELH